MKVNRSFFLGMVFNSAPQLCANLDDLLPRMDSLDQSIVTDKLSTVLSEQGHVALAESVQNNCTSPDLGIWYEQLQVHIFPKFR